MIKSSEWTLPLILGFIAFIAIFASAIYFDINSEPPTTTTTVNGRILTDNVSGCQYVTGGITGIYPRTGPDGIKIMGCKEQP